MAPFLEVLTRTYKRPVMLSANRDSLLAQTCGDWVQTILEDRVGRGVGAAQVRLADHADELMGLYVWILDDDDMCIRPEFVEELKQIAAEHDPDVIMVRMDHGSRGVLPGDDSWRKTPQLTRIGCSAYVVRRELWQAHADAFRGANYHSDYDFIKSVWDDGPVVYWHDVIASRVQRISLGAPE